MENSTRQLKKYKSEHAEIKYLNTIRKKYNKNSDV